MSCRMARMRSRRAEIPPHPFRNDGHQSQLQKGAPFKWPEKELLRAFNGRRNGVDGGDGLHRCPFPGSNSVLQNYAVLRREVPPPNYSVLKREVPPPREPSPPANLQTPPAPARTPFGAAPFCREPDAVLPHPACLDLSAPAGQM